MSVQKTLALLGNTGKNFPRLIEKLGEVDLRLLIICLGEEEVGKISAEFPSTKRAETEFITCPKSACWEADIIIFDRPDEIGDELIERIRNFSTQKIVLYISSISTGDAEKIKDTSELRKKFPFSKVIRVETDPGESGVILSGEDGEAIITVSGILKKAGYNIRNTGRTGIKNRKHEN